MDLHCYYQWRGDWVQDIVEFETRLHSLEVVCGMSSVAKAYDLIMMYRAELGVDTKYVELFQRATMRQPQIFFPPAEYDDHLPDWQLQRKRKQPEKTPNPKTKSPENCKFFLQGSCRYGNRCNKLHDRDLKGVLRKRPSDDANDGRRQRKKGNGRSWLAPEARMGGGSSPEGTHTQTHTWELQGCKLPEHVTFILRNDLFHIITFITHTRMTIAHTHTHMHTNSPTSWKKIPRIQPLHHLWVICMSVYRTKFRKFNQQP